MDDRPRSLRAMLAEAKDTSELMVDLAYAAVYFNDPGHGHRGGQLEERMNDLVQDMRAVCILAVRRPAEAEGMASVLQVISAIESIANAAVDITRIVTHRLGIPHELIADLSNAEEVSHRVWIREGSHMAHRPLKDLEITVQCGMRVVAIRRERSWMIDEIDGDLVLLPGDVLFLRGSPAGIARLHELAAAPTWEPPPVAAGRGADRPGPGGRRAGGDEEHLRGRGGAGLLGAGAARRGPGGRGPPPRRAPRRDEGPPAAVGAAGGEGRRRPVAAAWAAAARLGGRGAGRPGQPDGVADHRRLRVPPDRQAWRWARPTWWPTQVPGRAGLGGRRPSLAELQLDIEPGFHVLAIRRDNRYLYRPRGSVVLERG